MMNSESKSWKHVGARQLKSLTKEVQDELIREHLKKLQVAWKKPRRSKERNAA